jgi:zinc finger protein
MSTNCDICGYRDNEVKSGSAISEKGKRIGLGLGESEDLSTRDIIKVNMVRLSLDMLDTATS